MKTVDNFLVIRNHDIGHVIHNKVTATKRYLNTKAYCKVKNADRMAVLSLTINTLYGAVDMV